MSFLHAWYASVVPVVAMEHVASAVSLAKGLFSGGVSALEITLFLGRQAVGLCNSYIAPLTLLQAELMRRVRPKSTRKIQ